MRDSTAPTFIRLAALALLLPFAGGCRDGTAPEVFDPVGTLSFNYQGVASGSFMAAGELDIGPGMLPPATTGATAVSDQGALALLAARTASAGRMDFFTLLLGNVERTGTLALDPMQCTGELLAECRAGFFMLNVDPTALLDVTDIESLAGMGYVMVMGQVNITTLTPMRVRGTFAGYAMRPSDQNPQLLVVSNGTFDLPRRSN